MKNLLFTVLLLTASLAFAGDTTWKLDLSHSKALFTVSHMVISEVTGRFTDFDLNLIQKGNDFTGSTVSVTVKTTSINTDNDGRDKHLRSADFFDVEKYPEATFVSKSFTKNADGTYTVTGDFTLRGVTKQISLTAKFNGTMKDPWGNERAGFKVTGTINRAEYGLKWNKVLEAGGFMVGENIDLTFQVELVKEKNEEKK